MSQMPNDGNNSNRGSSLFEQMFQVQQQQLHHLQQAPIQTTYSNGAYNNPSSFQHVNNGVPYSGLEQQQQHQQHQEYQQQMNVNKYEPYPSGQSNMYNNYNQVLPRNTTPPPAPSSLQLQQQPISALSQPVYTPVVQDDDYLKGFHDGVLRPSGSSWGTALSWIAPVAVNVAFLILPVWYVRRKYAQSMASAMGGSGSASGKSASSSNWISDMMNPLKSKNYRTEVKGTTFKDVIGIPEAKEDLKQYVDFLKEPAKFTRLGARLPKGCLLTGGPGTGKTLLARAVAGEASTPFLTCSGADFIEIFGGSGPKRVRELFAEAKECAPCVVFIDEIDAIGSRNQGGRSMGGGGGGSSEENRTINQLLAELDGLSSSEAIVVIAATNYPEAIDKALLREGRFDRKVNIPMPDREARCELFEFYLNRIITGDPNCKPKMQRFRTRKEGESSTSASANSGSTTNKNEKEIGTDGTIVNESNDSNAVIITEELKDVKVIPGVSNKQYAEVLADRTPGVSPAQVATIVNEAALNAAATGKDVVSLDIIQNSIDDVLIGKKHRQRMSDKSLRRTAYHECGHCIMAWLQPLQKDVIKISIIPRGRAGGYTQQVHDEAMEPQTDEFLFSQLCVLMGGRVAERIFEEDISTGAMDDLQRATRLAMEKLLKYGMSKTIGQLAFKPNEQNDGRAWMTWSENLHTKVEKEARELVASAYNFTEKTLLANKDKHIKLAELLLQNKELSKADITSVLGERPTTQLPVIDATTNTNAAKLNINNSTLSFSLPITTCI